MKARPLALALGALLWSSAGFAFCRATTCNPVKEQCAVDTSTGCVSSGTPLRWASGCITVNVQASGAPRSGISADAAEASVRRALDAWLGADCGGDSPSLAVEIGQKVSCDAPEYSSDHHNANIVVFREGEWPYEGGEDALGVTWLSFDLDQSPGELWDADIELNAVAEPLAAGEPKANQVDLDSLVTHEVGHLLGLGHTLVEDGTMIAGYTKGSTALRSLAADDMAGICAIYPPGRTTQGSSCQPRHGFSELCAAEQPPFVEPDRSEPDPSSDSPKDSKGCALTASTNGSGAGAGWLVLVAAASRRWRRRGSFTG
jgi:hypothetical protein